MITQMLSSNGGKRPLGGNEQKPGRKLANAKPLHGQFSGDEFPLQATPEGGKRRMQLPRLLTTKRK